MRRDTRNNGSETARGSDGRFGRGNPGRPPGARHKATLAAEALLDGEAEGLTRKAVELALTGDTVALRPCLERVLPPRKDRPVRIDLPPLKSAADAAGAIAAIAASVAAGDVTLAEAAEASHIVEAFTWAVEAGEMERRLRVLEEAARLAK